MFVSRRTILGSEASEIFELLIQSGKADQLEDQRQIAGLKAAWRSARDYLKAMRIRRIMKDEIAKMFPDLDLLVAPSRLGVASKLTDPLDRRPTPTPTLNSGMTSLIPAGNLAGLPAIGTAVRIRRQTARGDSVGRPAVLRERAGIGG